jgi:hypothetical protein
LNSIQPMLKHIKLLIAFLYLPILVSGQTHKGFTWIGPDHSFFSVDLKTGILIKQTPKKSTVEVGKIKNWDNIKNELPGDFEVNSFYQGDSILFSIPGTGQIYSFRMPNLELNRLDQTFFRGYNFNAHQFYRNDTLFSIGGEGFWHKHSIITYYNPQTLEWSFYKLQKDNNHIVTDRLSGYSKKYDAFFSSFFDLDNVFQKENIPIMVYSFKTYKWENKGKLSEHITNYAKRNYRSVWTGNYLIILFDVSGSKLFIADPFENILFEYGSNDDQFFLLNNELYYRNGKIFSRSNSSLGKMDKIYFDSLSVDYLVENSKPIGSLYEEGNFSNRNIGLIIGALFLLSGSLFYYRKRRLKIEDYTLTEIEMLVVKKFINQDIGIKISSIEINNLLDITNKTYDNQRQIRYRIIGSINQKLYADLDSKDLIFRSSNIEDKRMMDYYINPGIKAKDLEKLTRKFSN